MGERQVSNHKGTLYVVATPIGNLDDISRRAVAVLRQVGRIAAEDTRHSRRLLQHHGIDTPMLALHEHNERRVLGQILQMLEAGQSVALISDAGTPLISDPGFPLVRECRRRGLKVSPLPGPSALVAALSVSGLPADSFCFHGFLPRTASARRQKLESLRGGEATLVFYESSHRIVDALNDMVVVFGDQRPAALARELTKQYEEVLQGTLEEIVAAIAADPQRQRGEFVVLLGMAEKEEQVLSDEALKVLAVLQAELPLKQAVALASRITGEKKNQLYRIALERVQEHD